MALNLDVAHTTKRNSATYGTHPLVTTPELLHLIFLNLRYSDALTTSARVCKLWSEHALDIIWERVDDMEGLFSVIAPLEQRYTFFRQDPVMIWEPADTAPRNWERFLYYARRVRDLRCTGLRSFDANVLKEIVRDRPYLHILPNLRKLSYPEDPTPEIWRAVSTLFLQPTLQSLSFVTPGPTSTVTPVDLEIFLTQIVSKAPDLTRFSWSNPYSTPVEDPGLSAPLATILQNLRKLRQVYIPSTYLTQDVLDALSNLDELGILKAHGFPHIWFPHTTSRHPEKPHPFPKLQALALDIPLSRLFGLELWPQPFSNITELKLVMVQPESSSAVERLLQDVSATCKFLSSLDISSRLAWANVGHIDSSCFTSESVKPLTQLPSLTHLHLRGPVPPHLKDHDLQLLLPHWPKLVSFDMGIDQGDSLHPRLFNTAGFTLDALSIFGRTCPRLTYLALHLDAITPSYVPQDVDIPEGERLKQLQKLTLGLSPIHNPQGPAIYLSKILPDGCYLRFGEQWSGWTNSTGPNAAEIRERSAQWGNVEMLVSSIRARTSRLSRRIQELEERVRVLERAALSQ